MIQTNPPKGFRQKKQKQTNRQKKRGAQEIPWPSRQPRQSNGPKEEPDFCSTRFPSTSALMYASSKKSSSKNGTRMRCHHAKFGDPTAAFGEGGDEKESLDEPYLLLKLLSLFFRLPWSSLSKCCLLRSKISDRDGSGVDGDGNNGTTGDEDDEDGGDDKVAAGSTGEEKVAGGSAGGGLLPPPPLLCTFRLTLSIAFKDTKVFTVEDAAAVALLEVVLAEYSTRLSFACRFASATARFSSFERFAHSGK
mmetsp:Transcript_44355/g.87302  ORF Transcript_44355/g.87302 Transcript_44355/m.87302 type:complete len:250 (-) Transcript_44355:702-1451(-)